MVAAILPGFDFVDWAGWRRRQRTPEGVEDKYKELSTRYHYKWWMECLEKVITLADLCCNLALVCQRVETTHEEWGGGLPAPDVQMADSHLEEVTLATHSVDQAVMRGV